jgi:hypothetical protein
MEFDVKVWQKELEKLGKNNLPSVVFLLAFLYPLTICVNYVVSTSRILD